MNNISNLADRLMVLETLIVHQDATIDDLNRMVTKQWDEIEILQRKFSEQRARLDLIENDLEPRDFDEKPPYY